MRSKNTLITLVVLPLVAAHGKVPLLTGDAGGNGTALGIKGGIIPGDGPNTETQVDTTVFLKNEFMSDGLGYTELGGNNKLSYVAKSMALSGNQLPQISATSGSISGIWHIVTADGAGPISAVLDPTGTGKFGNGVMLEVTTQVPGVDGYLREAKRSLWERTLTNLGLAKRAKNINRDYPISISIPDGRTCSGSIDGLSNVCLVKIANRSKAGPFGGVVAVQIGSIGAKDRRIASEFQA